jgi:hypothetical protein
VSGDVHTPTDAGAVRVDKTPRFEATPVPDEVPPLERTEVQVGAAFAGGLLFAMILKRLGH